MYERPQKNQSEGLTSHQQVDLEDGGKPGITRAGKLRQGQGGTQLAYQCGRTGLWRRSRCAHEAQGRDGRGRTIWADK